MIVLREYSLGFCDQNCTYIDNLGDLTAMARLYDLYCSLCGIYLLIIYIRVIQFFSFFRQLSNIMTIISRAKVNLAFFLMMYFFVRAGEDPT